MQCRRSCPVCIEAHGIGTQHRGREGAQVDQPGDIAEMVLDYRFLGDESESAEQMTFLGFMAGMSPRRFSSRAPTSTRSPTPFPSFRRRAIAESVSSRMASRPSRPSRWPVQVFVECGPRASGIVRRRPIAALLCGLCLRAALLRAFRSRR